MEEHPYKGTIKFNMHVRGSSHVRAYYTLESILLHKKTKKQKKTLVCTGLFVISG